MSDKLVRDPALRDYNNELLALAESELRFLPELTAILLSQAERLRAVLEKEEQADARLADAEQVLASLNAVAGTERSLLRPLRDAIPPLAAEDLDALSTINTLRAEVRGRADLEAAMDEIIRVFDGKARAIARTLDRIRRKLGQCAQL